MATATSSGAAGALAPSDASRSHTVPDGRGGARLPPGPKAPPIAQTLAWALAPTWLMDRCARTLGDLFTLTFFPSGMQLVMVSDPEAVKAVFTAPPEVAPSGAANSPVAPVMGLDAVIYEELARRRSREDLAERTDILSLLMQARDEQGRAMTDPELRDELVTLLLAGHETTATSVAWAIERLVRHPDKLGRLVAEIDAYPDGGEEYMTAVAQETLRVRPVVPIVG